MKGLLLCAAMVLFQFTGLQAQEAVPKTQKQNPKSRSFTSADVNAVEMASDTRIYYENARSNVDALPNPDLITTCDELRVTLILDESGSMTSGTRTEQTEDATLAFAQALQGSPALVSIVEFGSEARIIFEERQVDATFISELGDYLTGPGYDPPGLSLGLQTFQPIIDESDDCNDFSTNWQAALIAAGSTGPNLIILTTDGNPTSILDPDAPCGYTIFNGDADLDLAIEQANVLRDVNGDNVHIFGYGVTGANQSNIIEISGDDPFDPGNGDIFTQDFFLGPFETLAENLASSVNSICGVELGLTKTASPANICGDEEVTYTITVNNLGNPGLQGLEGFDDTADGVVLTDLLPAGFTMTASSIAPDSEIGNTLTFNLGNIASGDENEVTITITGNFPGASTETPVQFINTASVQAINALEETVDAVVTKSSTINVEVFETGCVSFDIDPSMYVDNPNNTDIITVPSEGIQLPVVISGTTDGNCPINVTVNVVIEDASVPTLEGPGATCEQSYTWPRNGVQYTPALLTQLASEQELPVIVTDPLEGATACDPKFQLDLSFATPEILNTEDGSFNIGVCNDIIPILLDDLPFLLADLVDISVVSVTETTVTTQTGTYPLGVPVLIPAIGTDASSGCPELVYVIFQLTDDCELCVDEDVDGICADVDCDDNDPNVGGPQTWYADMDGDGFGDPGNSTEACSQPDDFVADNTDCDDTDANLTVENASCDDGDPTTLDDTINEDCECIGVPTECTGIGDADMDGVCADVDCDDNDANVGGPQTWYADMDGDGFGDPGNSTEACSQPEDFVVDNTDCDDTDANLTVENASCDDGDPTTLDDTINEDCECIGVPTECTGIGDADMDGVCADVDCDDNDPNVGAGDPQTWYADTDGDGFGDLNNSIEACSQPEGYVDNNQDCDDSNAAINPVATEICDGVDNDCDGQVDEGVLNTYYADADEDGFGDPDDSIEACSQPEGYVDNDTDLCPEDGNKVEPGNCGCGNPELVDGDDCTTDFLQDGTVVDCECVANQTGITPCPDHRLFYANHIGNNPSTIYSIEINGDDEAILTEQLVLDYITHMAYNEDDDLLYFTQQSGQFVDIYDASTYDFIETLSYDPAGGGGVTAAVYNPDDGFLYVGGNNQVRQVDLSDGSYSVFADDVPVSGGDLVIQGGNLYLVTNSGDDIFLIDGINNPKVGDLPPGQVNGAALSADDQILISGNNFNALKQIDFAGDIVESFPTFLDGGEAFTLSFGDLASGCNSGDQTVTPCYPSEWLAFDQGLKTNGEPIGDDRSDPTRALGEPDANNEAGGFVSLGVGGSITLGFPGNANDGPGDDIFIYETSFSGDNCSGGGDERADIELSQDGINWVSAGTICRDGSVDIADYPGLDFVTAIRITNSASTNTPDGYDVDGVVAIYGCGPNDFEIPDGNCYGSQALVYEPQGSIPSNRMDKFQALGEPERDNSINFVALGFGGSITIGFDGAAPALAGVDDLEVVETTFGNKTCDSFEERADVYVSQQLVSDASEIDDDLFVYVGESCTNGAFFDVFAETGFDSFTMVKIVDVTPEDAQLPGRDGYDVDGVVAIHNCVDVPSGQLQLQASNPEVVMTTYPNPTDGQSNVTFTTGKTMRTILQVYDASGREVATLFNQTADAGMEYRLNFNGSSMPNGMYIYRLTTEDEVIIRKFMIAR